MSDARTDPNILTFLVADAVYRDHDSRKVIVAGIFSRVFADRFPTKHQRGGVLFIEASGETRGHIQVVFRKADSREMLLDLDIRMDHLSSGPADLLQMIVPLPFLPLPEVGEYVFEVLGTRLLRTHWLSVQQREGKP